jgi:hypothetical protein
MHPASSLSAPVAEYVPASNNIPTNLQILISGTTWGSAGTNILSATESALFTSNNPILLTNTWRTITNIVCASERPNSNDAVRITYRMLPVLYDLDAGWRLTPQSLNERKACVDKLLWTYYSSTNVYQRSNTQLAWAEGFTNYGGDISALWTDQKAIAESRWPGPTNAPPPLEWWPTNSYIIVGSLGEGRSIMYVSYMRPVLHTVDWWVTNAPPTNATASASCDYYAFASRYGEPYFNAAYLDACEFADVDGLGIRARYFSKIGSSVEVSGGRSMDAVTHDTTLPTWCGRPNPIFPFNTGFHASYGYEIQGNPIVIYRWDGTNGFRYR